MTVTGVQAWITSAVEDKAVRNALALAHSLRRVRTKHKLGVLTTLAVHKDLREKLKEVFDLVVFLEQESPNGLNLEDYAKIQGFSLLVFNKCVYLSPDTLVLKNSDEIFEKYIAFAVCGGENGEVDSSVYAFSPSLGYSRALEKIVHYVDLAGEKADGNFSKYFNKWLQNHVPNVEKLDEKFNVKLYLMNNANKSLDTNISIVNFGDIHPLDLPEEILSSKVTQLGAVEMYVVDYCWTIFLEDMKRKSSIQPTISTSSSNQYKHEPVAIVGMSFRLPGANNTDEFWNLLINGKEAIKPIPSFRWNKGQVCWSPQDKKVEAGFLNVPIDEFDAKFFNISQREVVFLDPQQRLLHEVTWEAFEDAGINPLSLRGTNTGVFVGSWLQDYKDIACRSYDLDFFRTYMGTSIASGAARLSYFLETTGPSIATESGCSSGIVSVHMACKSLRSHDSNLAVACGVNLLIHPFDQNTLNFVLAPDGRCKSFDSKANGFGRAEACATLLLKRLSDAVKDGNKIWGLVRGSAITQEGISKSLGTPTVHCEALAMELALKDAGVEAKDVDFVEAHGTGTPVGDPMEIAAITKVYSKGRNEPLVIGSVKTNVGHTESASGITGIIKVILSMQNEMIPPHLNLDTINPEINLDLIPAEIPMSPIPWPRNADKPRIAGVSSFGISGTDGHAIIEEPPATYQKTIDFKMERPLHFMKISAKSPESMESLLEKYHKLFTEASSENEQNEFAHIAYSANTGRATFNHRAVIIAKDFKEASKIIQNKTFKINDVQTTGGKLCFLFTGQGSQHIGMAESLYNTSPLFKLYFDQCNEVLEKRYNISIRDVMWGSSQDADKLSRTLYSQTSIFCVEYCLLKLWESWGVSPDFVLGHSLGEFAAAVAAGALSFDDALMLVAERSRLIDNLPHGKMLVIKSDKKVVDAVIADYKEKHPNFWVDYAALNSPEQTVVAGDSKSIDDFAKYCEKEKSLKSIILASSHAFHSRHMDSMLQPYWKAASTVIFNSNVSENSPKYISGMEGKLLESGDIDANYWVQHTREKVSFMEACRVAHSEGCTLFIEIGPHPVLSALAMMNIDTQIKCFPSIRRKENEWETLLESLAKLYTSEWQGQIDWKGFDQFYQRKRMSIPFYPFNRKSAWHKIRGVHAKLHPLLGRILPTAADRTIYENGFLLRQFHTRPLQGFTEDFIKPRRPIILKSLKIALPLAIYDSEPCNLQTVISLDDKEENEIGYAVNVYRQHDPDGSGTGQWISHASAKFLPVAPTSLPELSIKIDIPEIQSSWTKSDSRDFYDKLPEVGLRFGAKFQSLETAWRCEKGVLLKVKVPEDYESYLIHPIVADAMIQAIMLWNSKEGLKKKLQVPVQVTEFIWVASPEDASNVYAYCSTNEEGKPFCLLVDENGILALMRGVDFIETTVKLVEGMIQQQLVAMPKLWQDVWKNAPGPLQNSLTTSEVDPIKLTEEQEQELEAMNDIGDDEHRFHSIMDELTRAYFLDALYKLGWKLQPNSRFTVEELMSSLSLVGTSQKFISFFVRNMCQKGMFEETSDGFRCKEQIPQTTAMFEKISKKTLPKDCSRSEYKLLVDVGKNLADILVGKFEPLQLLFPEDPNKPSAFHFYDSRRPFTKPVVLFMTDHFLEPLYHKCCEMFRANKTSGKPVLRLLEVGSGTGVFSESFLKILDQKGIHFEYYYTDVSAVFFNSAAEKLEKFSKSIIYKKYNMDEDPFQQGFCPEYFDVVLALEAVHVAKDLRKTLKYIRSLMKPGGLIQIVESIIAHPIITFLFGILPGYWQNDDVEFRPHHITLTGEKWKQVLSETQFTDLRVAPSYDGVHGVIHGFATTTTQKDLLMGLGKPAHSWLIFDNGSELSALLRRKLTKLNRDVLIVQYSVDEEYTEDSIKAFINKCVNQASEEEKKLEGIIYLWGLSNEATLRDQRKLSLPFISLCQRLTEMTSSPRVYAITQGTCTANDTEVVNPNPCTILGILKALGNEQGHLNLSHLDLDPSISIVEQLEQIFFSLWQETPDFMCFRGEKRLANRLTSAKVQKEDLSIPNGCDRFQLILPKTRAISDLEFGFLDPYDLGENEVEVQIKTMALNFRDVFTVLKPIADFETFNAVGLDWAGVVTRIGSGVTTRKVGDRVMGMNMTRHLSLPSHYKADETLAIPVPSNFTFAEAATLPAVVSTTVYCLNNIAKMKREDTVLIHTASGGVGLCAIQLAKHVGAKIIATAGSVRKRNFLRNLGIEHVFHSRNTDYGQQILDITNGRGVDIVLNSLTGEGFKEASLKACAKNARFVEMSKLNIWTEEEVRSQGRPDVLYYTVDLTTLEKPDYERLSETLKKYMSNDTIRPLPYERFDALNIRGALNYLQKAKHIGKIVCVMPEVKVENSKFKAITPLFNPDSTYLVTGGLGGIGFEVVKWILRKGGKHVAIASRSVPFPELAKQIEEWNNDGAHVQAFAVDVGDYQQCSQLLESIQSPELGFPPLRGVMHAAGVLKDDILDNQTWEKFEHTYNPKVKGSWNLHDLTKDHLLEHFVLFSSIAATLGSPGQTNHAASNSFEDGLAYYRHAQGLPATCVNWGNWGEVGVATEIDFPGLRPISTSEGLLALETFLTTQKSHLAVLNIESFGMLCKAFPRVKTYVDDKRLLGEIKTKILINSDMFWAEVDNALDREAKIVVFKNFIKTVVKNTLKLDADEIIDDHAEFQALGIDSLMTLEMKNSLQNILGTRMALTAAQLKDCNTTEILANRLVDILEGNEENANIPTQEELKLLVREDSCLPEHINSQNASIKPVSEIRTVLLTGCTGTLGPYTLRDLSNKTDISKIYCLVRKSGKSTPLERVRSRLTHLKLLDQVDMEKVECIQGDITTPNFGLPEDEYSKLCEEVDAVIHNAIKADHQARYWKSPETFKTTVRTVNVKGAIRILEFAVDKTLKHVLYSSSLLTVVGVTIDGSISEDWQDIGTYDDFTFNAGYPLSKFIAEQLFEKAIERGIPCKVFRFPIITGESNTGRCDFESNHYLLRWLAMMKLRAMPEEVAPLPVLPVDRCSKVALDVFLNQNASYDVYNLGQYKCEVEQVLISVAKDFGIDVEPVPTRDFISKLKAEDANSPLAPLVKEYIEFESTNFLQVDSPLMETLRNYLNNTESFFRNYKISKHVPNFNAETESSSEVMHRDLKYLKDLGIFEKFGIICK
ncbi:Lovastatin diketide synthase LovF [Orchesella cincta]|uniref:Lovastatin diketide synthase LovF n=1 Tax=Orchesella cincta TaxID=48709 RepID=A0A1D2N0C3_ORCCI|nr:Lovastatin diketide synthase LovF [Orchesella cincta]